MAWVKLVDSEGRVAGHAVLSARISMGMLGDKVCVCVWRGLGSCGRAARLLHEYSSCRQVIDLVASSSCHSAACPLSHPRSLALSSPLLPPKGLMGPCASKDTRGLPSDDGLSINQTEQLPTPMSAMALQPPRASPMPPTGLASMTPATGGKAPATATGGYLQVRYGCLGDDVLLWRCLLPVRTLFFLPSLCPPAATPTAPTPPRCAPLQVSSLQVYDELLESALRAVGCGPRALALHGPWVWLLDRFCESYAVGRNYARLSYLKWVVRPENATLTADCFDVLLRDMVALQQAAAVDGLSSGELGVQAQVRQGLYS